jgi:hypothetical protein
MTSCFIVRDTVTVLVCQKGFVLFDSQLSGKSKVFPFTDMKSERLARRSQGYDIPTAFADWTGSLIKKAAAMRVEKSEKMYVGVR